MAGALRCGLTTLTPFYAAGSATRNALYNAGVLRTHSANVPVVSVGNITTGGTGKTPFVAWLTHWFHARNIRVAILSRGYRALAGEVNDEKLVLDQLCPGVPHLQQPDRAASAQRAVREFGSQVLILDDGFQHRRLRRDLDIVLIDALEPFGYGHLLPRGLLRESLGGLRRANLVVITRADQVSDEVRRGIHAEVTKHSGGKPIVEVGFLPDKLVNARGETKPLSSIADGTVAAFCGIGNPDGFRRTLATANLTIDASGFRAFPDHHHYTASDLDEIGRHAVERGLNVIVTTQKDLVKIPRIELAGIPLWGLRISAGILKGEDLVDDHLFEIADRIHR